MRYCGNRCTLTDGSIRRGGRICGVSMETVSTLLSCTATGQEVMSQHTPKKVQKYQNQVRAATCSGGGGVGGSGLMSLTGGVRAHLSTQASFLGFPWQRMETPLVLCITKPSDFNAATALSQSVTRNRTQCGRGMCCHSNHCGQRTQGSCGYGPVAHRHLGEWLNVV